jgi:transcription-repair coupling factor (superfamily II helicase)
MEELGSGFFLAMHDLEIRGAGEVLGESQSGEIQEIGFNLYTSMLNAAVRALKEGKEPDLTQPLGVTSEINLHAPALLPERLLQRRARAPDALQAPRQLRRRGGTAAPAGGADRPLRRAAGPGAHPARDPPPAHPGQAPGLAKIDATEAVIKLQFVPNPPIDPARIIQLVQQDRRWKLAGPDKLSRRPRNRHPARACGGNP